MYTDLRLYMSNALHNIGVSRDAFDADRRMNECAEAVTAADLPLLIRRSRDA